MSLLIRMVGSSGVITISVAGRSIARARGSVTGRGEVIGVDKDGYRAVIDECDFHFRAETAALAANPGRLDGVAETIVESGGDLGPGGAVE